MNVIDLEQLKIEEEYTDENENLLNLWLETAREKSEAHNIMGRRFKLKHEVVGLPAYVLPIAYSPLSGLFADEENIKYANVFVLVTSGLLSSVYTFFDFGRKSQRHFDYEARYSDLVTTIMVEMSKRREIRIRADRFIEMIQSKIDNLGANAPLL